MYVFFNDPSQYLSLISDNLIRFKFKLSLYGLNEMKVQGTSFAYDVH